MAAGVYTRLVDDALRTGNGNTDTAAETARKTARTGSPAGSTAS
jgi:hypothetical protein